MWWSGGGRAGGGKAAQRLLPYKATRPARPCWLSGRFGLADRLGPAHALRVRQPFVATHHPPATPPEGFLGARWGERLDDASAEHVCINFVSMGTKVMDMMSDSDGTDAADLSKEC